MKNEKWKLKNQKVWICLKIILAIIFTLHQSNRLKQYHFLMTNILRIM